jgi:hypothetical protein
MKKFLALMSFAVFALASALPVSAGEASPSCAYETASAPVASIAAVPPADSAAVASQDTQNRFDPAAHAATPELTQVAGLFSWFVWCPSTGTYTCPFCCPPLNR